jgi:cellulose synthase operon protein C
LINWNKPQVRLAGNSSILTGKEIMPKESKSFRVSVFVLVLFVNCVSLLNAQAPPRATPAATTATADPLAAVRQDVTKGQYKEAMERLEPLLAKGTSSSEAMPLLMESLLATGEYRKAAERGEDYLTRRAEPPVMMAVAEAWSRLGEYEKTEKVLASATTVRGSWMRGKLAARRGQREQSDNLFSEVISRGSSNAQLSVNDQLAVADAMIELARYQDANGVFQRLEKAFPDDPTVKARWGELMSAKNNPSTAGALFGEALEINPNHPVALVGMAGQIADSFDSKAGELVSRALAVNPKLEEAHLLSVRMKLEEEKWAEAATELDEIDKVNPRSLAAWSMRAGLAFLQDRKDEVEQTWVPKILKENPGYGEVFELLGNLGVTHRLYEEAVAFYRRALEKNDRLDDARSSLGINLFRLGKEEEAKRTLEQAYERDKFNIWTVNTLRLMDSYSRFDSFENDKFKVKLHQKESALLRPYIEKILSESLETLTKRYNYTPPGKVIFEMFPDHEDFAVRTLGLPGLGALGASFGPVVAMDSPSARPSEDFHWGSTLWHELAHVITLGITKNRIPRWFTEGISVYEEAHSKTGWGDPFSLSMIQALQKYGLVPMSDLNGVFVRPKYPNQVVFAYFQGGLICEYIIEKHGFAKLNEMIRAYAEAKTDEQVFKELLGVSLTEFDNQFKEYARAKTYDFGKAVDFSSMNKMGLNIAPSNLPKPKEEGKPGEQGKEGEEGEGNQVNIETFVQGVLSEAQGNPQDFIGKLRAAARLHREKKDDEAIKMAEEAKAMLPPYTEDANPYELLAEIYESRGEEEKAVAELMTWRQNRGRNPEAFAKLAALLHELGRKKEAIQVVEDSLQVSMFDIKSHQRLGDWSLEEGDNEAAVRAFQGVIALNPPDKAEAHYKLATAYMKLSDKPKARTQVLAALEIAPGYRPAQKLLLDLAGAE